MKREGLTLPKFTEHFFRADFEAEPMPVLSLYPFPKPIALAEVVIDICGLEQHPRRIGWPILSALPRVKVDPTLICQIFNWSEQVQWEGIRLVALLDYLKIDTHPEGYFGFYSRDGVFFEGLSRDEARDERVILACGLNGGPLPEAHGGPLRLVVPFLQGYKSVKWLHAIRAYRNDPIGIKRLLGQSPTGLLNAAWMKRCDITPSAGRPGDPPLFASTPVATPAPVEAPVTPPREVFSRVEGEVDPVAATRRPSPSATLKEVVAIVRPQKHTATRQALEAIGVYSYTTLGVLGRSRQRGLRFAADPKGGKEAVAIKFLPKQYFSIVVEARQVPQVVAAIVKANQTGPGTFGDGKIFVTDVVNAVRISNFDQGAEAI